MTVEKQVADLGREVGQLTTAVHHMAEQMERDREERKEFRKETRDRLNSHSGEIKGLQRVRNLLAGALAVGAGFFGVKLHWPF